MATAALSVAAHAQGAARLAALLGWLNVGMYAVLLALLVWRVARYPRDVMADLSDHLKSPGFFTLVAGTCTLGSQLLVEGGPAGVAWLLWAVGITTWAAVMYTVFTALTIKDGKPPLEEGLSGAWLLAVVATQSVSVLSALLAPRLGPAARLGFEFLALSLLLFGGMLYVWMISLIFYRYTFLPLAPSDLSPPYWINMGAMAISTLAGATLLLTSGGASPLLGPLHAFVAGVTVLFWATGTWWIPMLLTLGAWRHVARRFLWRYDVSYWGAVFPLAMYTLATSRLSQALDLEFLRVVPRVGLVVASAAWVVVFIGMARAVLAAGVRQAAGARPA